MEGARKVDQQRDAPDQRAPAAPLAAVLDVGVSKTVCLVARRDPVLDLHPERPLRVLGVGHQIAPAIASGKPADFEACARSIQVAIEEASAMAGSQVSRVTACYSGPGIDARIVRGATRLKSAAVTSRDIDNVIRAAMQAAPAPQRSFLHVEPLRYRVDEGQPTADPNGQTGKMLAVEACVVTAPTEALNALKACIGQAGVEVEEVIAGPQAAALAVLSPDEREQGALLIDIGAGSIGVAAFAGEGLVHCETIPAGGVRLTRDLAMRLRTTFAAAERVKLHYGVVGQGLDPREAVQAPKLGADGRLEASTTLRGVIAETLTPRLYEMLLATRDRLNRAGFCGPNGPQRAVLVGGGAMIPGVRDLAVEALGIPVRLGRPLELCGFDHGEAGPAYAASAGLLRHRLDAPALETVTEGFQPTMEQAAAAMRNAVHGAWAWLRENF